MIRTTGLLLVIVLGLGATRDIVCQLTCAEPDAAHATAACHESSDMGGTLLQAVQDQCVGIDASPATTSGKVNPVQVQGSTVFTRFASTAQVTPGASPTLRDRSYFACSSPPRNILVLRI